MHECCQRTSEATPNAAGILEIEARTNETCEQDIDEPVIRSGVHDDAIAILAVEHEVERTSKHRVGPDPGDDSVNEEHGRNGEKGLADHVESVPEGTMGHLVAMTVTHGFN